MSLCPVGESVANGPFESVTVREALADSPVPQHQQQSADRDHVPGGADHLRHTSRGPDDHGGRRTVLRSHWS